ncbi:MAG: Gfo/Idh/MocA family oxidoreductase [Pirellulales bacterium]|nr:Gfo/Idh/MocA family oxidoreductase [Pirellulales bacterium]
MPRQAMPREDKQTDSLRNAGNVSRRGFMAGAGAAAVSLSVIKPELAFSYAANEKVSIGVMGCGGRGTWIAELFQQHGGYEIAAAADYFQDRVDNLGNKLNVKPERRYTGLSGYRRMLEGKLDAVMVESPPYFHPEQAAAGVEAGCHVYLAKPIAVDVPGCKTIEASGKAATAKKLCFLVDFQTRADEFYIEALKRTHEGALGKLAFGEATYHAGIPWGGQIQYMEKDPDNPENRLRAWGLDRVLSGDIITEQNIHTLDVANWIMNGPPVCAYGTGGRKVREFGDCWDTFSVVFQYPDDVGITFSSRQFNGHGTQPEGIRNRMFGADGVLETSYGGEVMIRGKNFYRGGSSPAIYRQGAVNNIATFHASIQSGDHANATVPESVRSNLLTILGRTAAYGHRVVTWEEVLRSDEKLDAGLKGLKD